MNYGQDNLNSVFLNKMLSRKCLVVHWFNMEFGRKCLVGNVKEVILSLSYGLGLGFGFGFGFLFF